MPPSPSSRPSSDGQPVIPTRPSVKSATRARQSIPEGKTRPGDGASHNIGRSRRNSYVSFEWSRTIDVATDEDDHPDAPRRTILDPRWGRPTSSTSEDRSSALCAPHRLIVRASMPMTRPAIAGSSSGAELLRHRRRPRPPLRSRVLGHDGQEGGEPFSSTQASISRDRRCDRACSDTAASRSPPPRRRSLRACSSRSASARRSRG